jgi:hypothetical protein
MQHCVCDVDRPVGMLCARGLARLYMSGAFSYGVVYLDSHMNGYLDQMSNELVLARTYRKSTILSYKRQSFNADNVRRCSRVCTDV